MWEIAALLVLAGWTWQCIRLTPTGDDAGASWWAGAYLPPFALCIWVFARGGGFVSRVLASRPLAYLGEISYAVYMLHLPVISYCLVHGKSFGFPGWPWQVRWAFVTVCVLGLSAACYHLYEIPLRDRWRRALSLGRKPAVTAPTSVEPPARRAA